MKTQKKTIWFAVLVVSIVAISVWFSVPPKPTLYQGRTVKEWVIRLDPDVNYQKQRDEAGRALEQIGTNALPDLERILEWRPNKSMEILERYAVRFHLMKPPSLHPLEMQSRACEAAYTLAEGANVDISRLIPHLRYHFTNGTYADSSSSRALAHAGPYGIAALTNLMFTGTRNVRDQSGWALAAVSRKPEVYSMLIAATSVEKDAGMRANLLLYLQRSEAPADQVVPLATKFFHSDDSYQQWTAVTLLSAYRDLPEVRAALEEARTNSDVRVRSTAERALRN